MGYQFRVGNKRKISKTVLFTIDMVHTGNDKGHMDERLQTQLKTEEGRRMQFLQFRGG